MNVKITYRYSRNSFLDIIFGAAHWVQIETVEGEFFSESAFGFTKNMALGRAKKKLIKKIKNPRVLRETYMGDLETFIFPK